MTAAMKENATGMRRDAALSGHNFLQGRSSVLLDASDSSRTWNSEAVCEAEKSVEKIKLGAEALSLRTKLMEKNILIYQTHQFLTRLESDYLSRSSSGACTLPTPSQNSVDLYSSTQGYWDTDLNGPPSSSRHFETVSRDPVDAGYVNGSPDTRTFQGRTFELSGSDSSDSKTEAENPHGVHGIRNELTGLYVNSKAENDSLRQNLEDANRRIQGLRNTLKIVAPMESRRSHSSWSRTVNRSADAFREFNQMADHVVSLMTQLEKERRAFRKEVKRAGAEYAAHVPKYISKYTATSSNVGEAVRLKGDAAERKIAMDEIMRLQGEQIERYEAYVRRLHKEILEWMNPGGTSISPEKLLDPSTCESVIGGLRQKIECDSQVSEAKEKNAELVTKLEQMESVLQEIRERENELRTENNLLRDIIADLNIAMRRSETVLRDIGHKA